MDGGTKRRKRTANINAINNLVAHNAVNLLGGILDAVGSGSLSSEAGRESSRSVNGESSGSESHTADDVLGEERHDDCLLVCEFRLEVQGEIDGEKLEFDFLMDEEKMKKMKEGKVTQLYACLYDELLLALTSP